VVVEKKEKKEEAHAHGAIGLGHNKEPVKVLDHSPRNLGKEGFIFNHRDSLFVVVLALSKRNLKAEQKNRKTEREKKKKQKNKG